MWTAFREVLPYAFALALSPFAIVTGVVLLLGDGGRLRAALFGLGWFAAILVVASVAFWVVDAAYDAYPEETETGVDLLQLGLGLLFLALAAISWRRRPAEGEPSGEAKMLDRLTGISPYGALALGEAQGVLVIGNLPLAIGAGVVVGETGVSDGEAMVALVLFALVVTGGVIVPLVASLVGGAKMTSALAALRGWLEANLTSVTVVILLLLGALFVGNGLRLLG